MSIKDYNSFINSLSIILKPINQLLYQCLVLITFYYLFDTLSSITSIKQLLNTNTNATTSATTSATTKNNSFINLIALIFIIIDWFIWNNVIQTTLFTAIILIYISYNNNKVIEISSYIKTINDSRYKNNNIKKLKIENFESLKQLENIDKINKEQIENITFIPKDIYYDGVGVSDGVRDGVSDGVSDGMDNNNKQKANTKDIKYTKDTKQNKNPYPYEKYVSKNLDNYEINAVYTSGDLPTNVVFTNYTNNILNNLYDSSQYKNIKNDNIDESLGNSIYKSQTDNSIPDNANNNKFRNPERVFIDDKWLSTKDGTYNDNCKTCLDSTTNESISNKNKGKNAICALGKYANELAECTNQDETVNDNQLKKISSNKIEPIYKF